LNILVSQEVSGISCVYEKVMRVPSNLNLRDLEWQTADETPENKDESDIRASANDGNIYNGGSSIVGRFATLFGENTSD